jgi:hypothetical protein
MRKLAVLIACFAAASLAAGSAPAHALRHLDSPAAKVFASPVKYKKTAGVRKGTKKRANAKHHHKRSAKLKRRHRRDAYRMDCWSWPDHCGARHVRRRATGWYHEPYPDHVGDGPFPQWILPDGTLTGPIAYPANGG